MRTLAVLSAALAYIDYATAARILQGNDDGWAELYVRSFNDALNAAGHDVVLSCPAENKSGTSSSDAEPDPRTQPCQYDSCPANSGPVGTNATNPRLNWVNAFPVTGVRYGIEQFGPQFWNGQPPELVVTGPNVGSNIWAQVLLSGTVGAAVYAVAEAGIPAIAISGGSDGALPWNTSPVPQRSLVYAELATKLTNAVLAAGAPYLPAGVFLNVNFPKVEGKCTQASSYKWVLSRINPRTPVISTPDVRTCNRDTLPTEFDVWTKEDDCYISVSVGDSKDKTTADAARQAVVLQKLGSLLTCLP